MQHPSTVECKSLTKSFEMLCYRSHVHRIVHTSVLAACRCSRTYHRQPTLGKNKGVRVSVLAVSKVDTSDIVRVPLDYYACFGLSKTASASSVRRAYEKLLSSPPDVGYSEDTLFSRAVLLRSAFQTLSNLESRRAYDSNGQAVNVSPQQLPSALVLLQESGESQIVVELGSSWLQHHAHDPFAGDVAVAVALAHCDEAAHALEADNGTVVLQACKHLEASLQLLREHKMAAGLQHLIMQTLEDYSPRYCIELLRLPLGEGQQRQRGFRLLRKLAFELPPETSPLGKDRDDFLSKARTCMLPQEQLDVYKSLPVGARQAVQQKLDIALATVAIGYQQRNPRVVQHAASLLRQLQSTAAQEGSFMDVSVERAACCLLLGDAQQALQLLRFADGQHLQHEQHSSSQDSIKAFVLEHSPDGSDLLPGLYMLTTAWIQEAVVCGFRPEAFNAPEDQDPADLALWFESSQVQLYVQALTVMRRLSIVAMLQAIPAAVAAFFVGLWRGTVQAALGQRGSSNQSAAATSEGSWEVASVPEAPVSSPSSRSASPAPAILRPASPQLTGTCDMEQQVVPDLYQQPVQHTMTSEDELSVVSQEDALAPLEVSLRAKLRSRTGRFYDTDDQDQPLRSFNPNREQQLRALEMEMWDAYTTPAGLGRHWATRCQQALLVVLLGVAAAAALTHSKGINRPLLAAPPTAEMLWETARC